MSHIHWVPRQNKLETAKEKGEVKKREIHECDVWARDPDAMVDPPTPKPTYKAEAFIVVYYESRKRELKTHQKKILIINLTVSSKLDILKKDLFTRNIISSKPYPICSKPKIIWSKHIFF